jgi:hypothetical protein
MLLISKNFCNKKKKNQIKPKIKKEKGKKLKKVEKVKKVKRVKRVKKVIHHLNKMIKIR